MRKRPLFRQRSLFKRPAFKRAVRSAFTLVELLVVMSIIAILAAMLMPAVNSVREQGRRTQCMNNMRNAGIALTQFDAKKGVLPGFRQIIGGGNKERSWVFAILPELERNDIYKQFVGSNTDPDVHIPVLTCPNDSTARRGSNISMVVNAGRPNNIDDCGSSAVFHHHTESDSSRLFYVGLSQISAGDGTSQTLMVSENTGATSWNNLTQSDNSFNFDDTDTKYLPNKTGNLNGGRAASLHPGGVNVVWCDSHTSFISDSVNINVWKLLFTPFGQNMVTDKQNEILSTDKLEAL